MGYRKITVDGVEHQFTIGRTHVKVRGMEAALREDVGKLRDYDPPCECCGEPLSVVYPDEYPRKKLMVTPEDVADFIRSRVEEPAGG